VAMNTQYLGICSGQIRQVYGKDEADHYLWSTGSTDRFIEVGSAGPYWVRSTKDCLVYIDTFIVDTIAYTILVVNADSFICPGEPLMLSGPPGYTRYLWSNGGTQQETNVFNEGKIVLRAEEDSSCKWFTGEYSIAYIRFVKPLHDTFICNDEPVSLDAAVTFPQAVYAWSSGARTSHILVSTPGRYIITVNAGNCRMSDSLSVTGKSLKLDIDESRTVCKGEILILNVGLDNADYKWSTGDTKASIEISSPGLYSVVVSDGMCSVKKEVTVSFEDCEHCVLFPNAFTPNNDGRNDYFKPILSCPIRVYELIVANRWGNVLFSSTDPNTGWNGMVNGRLLDPGVYYYFLKAAFDSQNTRVLKGDVTLIR
ncbi:MAG TPA: T9SS type B sorting domain-containing protein, partial [Chitinophagaceae bacterium]|nr:T9SS type B sorting domain-containing protein [Chitinophagaceae bacterium]